MVTTEQKLTRWVVFVEDLLRLDRREFPAGEMLDQLWETFDAEPAWLRVEPDGRSAFAALHPIAGWPTPEWQEYWGRERLHRPSPGLRTLMLGRAGRDFSDDDMDLARRVQPLLWLVDRQASVISASTTTAASRLTGRELAVLGLLSQGCTAAAIGRRLGCSPRTVHKHLEHLYRKLDVRDRLMAVQVGSQQGLLARSPARSPSLHHQPLPLM